MNRRAICFLIAAVLYCCFPANSANAQVTPNPDYQNGAYVTSQIVANGNGQATAKCLTEALDPASPGYPNSTPTQTASLYQYFSTYCSISPDPTNTLNSAAQISCSPDPPTSPVGQDSSDYGSGDAGNPQGDCTFQFNLTPGTTYTLNSQHYIWLYSDQGVCINGSYSDPQDYYDYAQGLVGGQWADTGYPFQNQTANLTAFTGDAYEYAQPGQESCMVQNAPSGTVGVLNSDGAFLVATTSASFAAVTVTPPLGIAAKLYQTQQLSLSSNLSALQAVSGNSDSITWCIEAPLAGGSTGTSCDAGSAEGFGELTVSNGTNSALYTAPSSAVSPGTNSETVLVCAQDNLIVDSSGGIPVSIVSQSS